MGNVSLADEALPDSVEVSLLITVALPRQAIANTSQRGYYKYKYYRLLMMHMINLQPYDQT